MRIHPIKPDRSRIDLANEEIAKKWAKKLGRSPEEIAAAIEKVGDSAAAVRKELEAAK
jgi:uncharacterized protein DUF3606